MGCRIFLRLRLWRGLGAQLRHIGPEAAPAQLIEHGRLRASGAACEQNCSMLVSDVEAWVAIIVRRTEARPFPA